MRMLLYGAGLRLMECCQLRVKDIDWANNQIVVRAGKGNKDRHTMLPASIRDALELHLDWARGQHQEDLARGLGRVALPSALHRKYPNAPAAISTSRYCNALSGKPASKPGSLNPPAATPSATMPSSA